MKGKLLGSPRFCKQVRVPGWASWPHCYVGTEALSPESTSHRTKCLCKRLFPNIRSCVHTQTLDPQTSLAQLQIHRRALGRTGKPTASNLSAGARDQGI